MPLFGFPRRAAASAPVLILVSMLASPAHAQQQLYEFQGQLEFDFLGATVSDAGDVDADGHDDVVVGLFGYNPLGGRAQVYSGRTGALIRTLSVIDFGSATGAGDVDGDGHADVLVGDTGDSTNGMSSGRALIFSGSSGNVLHTFLGVGFRDYFGSSVSDAGDVNADGWPDVVVGATESTNPNPGPGYVRVFSGLDGSLLHEFTGDAPGDRFATVSGAGDVDADGHADIIVGASAASTNGTLSGLVRVFSGQTGAILHELTGDAALHRLGFAVSGAGDMDADGRADFIVGIPGANNFAGEVRVYSGATGTPIHTFLGGGSTTSDAGDVDGDGVPDLIIGGGDARVFSGLDGSLLFTVTGPDLGDTVSGAGDVNNDCFADVIVGAPIFSGQQAPEIGKAFVFSGVSDGFEIYCDANPNSTGIPAFVCGSGSTVVADNDLTLEAFHLPLNQFGYFLTSQTQGFVPNPGGSQGNLCLGGTIGRFVQQVQNSGASGSFTIQVDLTTMPPPVQPIVQPGDTWNFQCWYRDVGGQNNFTNAVSVTFR